MIWYLILLAVIVVLLILGGSLLFVRKYQHPDEVNKAWHCKILVVFGLTLACVQCLLIPFDIAFNGAEFNPLPTIWQVCYIGTAVYCFGVAPFFLVFYTSDEFSSFLKRLCTSLCWSILAGIGFCIVIGIGFAFLAEVEIPVESHGAPMLSEKQFKCLMANNKLSTIDCGQIAIKKLSSLYTVFDHVVKLRTTLVVFVLAMVAFIGSFLVMLYAGIGLFGLPLSMINAYRLRPHYISKDQFVTKKLEIAAWTRDLIDCAVKYRDQNMKKTSYTFSPRNDRFVNKVKSTLYELEKDYEKLIEAEKTHGQTSLWPYVHLVVGCICLVIASSWFIHILVYMFLKPAVRQPFLNSIFNQLSAAFPLAGVLAYMTFAVYLLFASVKGQMIFGMRFFLIAIHPLVPAGTMMNSMLFNASVIVLCSAACCRFCADAFDGYVAGTSTAQLFGTQVKYLKGIKIFYQYLVFYYIFFGMSALTALYMTIRPYFNKPKPKTAAEAIALQR